MKKIIIVLFLCFINIFAGSFDFTQADQQFINYSDKMVKQFVQNKNNAILINSSLAGYTKAIQNSLDTYLKNTLTNNIFNKDDYINAIKKSFEDGFKKETISKINNNSILTENQKQDITKNINEIQGFDNLKNYFSNLNIEAGTGEDATSFSGENLADETDTIENASNQMQTSFTFMCVCASDLSSAFSRFMNHIMNDNLVPSLTNLKKLKKTVNTAYKLQQKQEKLLKKSNNLLAGKIIEVKNLIKQIEKQKEIYKRKQNEK